jgi:hypothetical protein
MRQEIYFGGHGGQSPEYPDVYLDIRAGPIDIYHAEIRPQAAYHGG